MKNFKDFINIGIIKKVSLNKSKARDLFQESERKKASLEKILKLIGLSEENANDIVEYCYDIIICLLRARLYLGGFKSSGEGAHEAEVSYLKESGFSETNANFMDEIRYFRNGIKYYGKRLSKDYAKKVISFTDKILPLLKGLVKKELD